MVWDIKNRKLHSKQKFKYPFDEENELYKQIVCKISGIKNPIANLNVK